MNISHKIRKIVLILTAVAVVLAVLVIAFISPITKYLVEKYDEQYTGRQITMDWAYVNPFTGYVHFSNLKIYELKSDSLFFSTKGMSINVEMFKLLTKTYEISDLTLYQPNGYITQIKKNFNFNDLVEKFSPKGMVDTLTAPVHFNILNTKITEGVFHYRDPLMPVNYFIKNVYFESSGKRWDSDTIAAKFSFESGIKTGDVKGNFMVNVKEKTFRLAIAVHKFDLQIVEQYLKGLTNYGSFRANLDADVQSSGNILHKDNTTQSGWLQINDFHFGKTPNEDYASFEKLHIAMHELSPQKLVYNYDSLILTRPFFKYERYDNMDNLQTMFGKKMSKIADAKANTAQFNLIIEIADYIKLISQNFFKSRFKIGKVAVYKGDLKFNDFSKSEKFSMDFNPLTIVADSIDKMHHRATIFMNTDIKPFGQATATLSIDPKDSSDFDLQYKFQKMPVSMFNPYTVAYTSFPLDRGTLDLSGTWHVRNSQIESKNHLLIVDPRTGSREKNDDKKWIPLPLVMAFIRERGNVIDYDIPITGSLKNPKFNLHDVIWDIIKNIFVKPPTTLYGLEVKKVENDIEKLLTLKWGMRESTLPRIERRFVRQMVAFLTDNPTASIDVYPQLFSQKEKEYILFFEAKKKFYLETNKKTAAEFSEKDSTKVDRMSVKDTLFVAYLNQHINRKTTFTIQDKCAKWIGLDIVNAKFNQLNAARTTTFMAYFDKEDVKKRLRLHESKDVVPYNGFTLYKIAYVGLSPKTLTEAYEKLKKLNEESPRKEFEQKRQKNGGLVH